jgi:acyl transferase domain-containing protein
VSNETAERGPAYAKEAVELVLSQLTGPMRLHRAIEFLLAEGASELVVLGPHHSLHHILKRHLEQHPTVRIHGSSSLEELRTIVRELA